MMFEIRFGKGYTEIGSLHKDWISAVKEAVEIAKREGDYIVSITHRPDRNFENFIK